MEVLVLSTNNASLSQIFCLHQNPAPHRSCFFFFSTSFSALLFFFFFFFFVCLFACVCVCVLDGVTYILVSYHQQTQGSWDMLFGNYSIYSLFFLNKQSEVTDMKCRLIHMWIRVYGSLLKCFCDEMGFGVKNFRSRWGDYFMGGTDCKCKTSFSLWLNLVKGLDLGMGNTELFQYNMICGFGQNHRLQIKFWSSLTWFDLKLSGLVQNYFRGTGERIVVLFLHFDFFF